MHAQATDRTESRLADLIDAHHLLDKAAAEAREKEARAVAAGEAARGELLRELRSLGLQSSRDPVADGQLVILRDGRAIGLQSFDESPTGLPDFVVYPAGGGEGRSF